MGGRKQEKNAAPFESLKGAASAFVVYSFSCLFFPYQQI
jgi:hypothetical protein